MNILFLGNSFTFFNDMPQILMNMGSRFDLYTEHVTKGGYFLHKYLNPEDPWNRRFLDALNSRHWDYVVLQDQSANPARDREDFLQSAARLCSIVRDAGAEPVFYQTWSYRDGSEKLAKSGMTHREMYEKLRSAYRQAAEENHAAIVPVGDVFFHHMQNGNRPDILRSDDYHPNLAGSYLIAYIFFRHFFPGEKTDFIPEGLGAEDAQLLRASAEEYTAY